MIDHQTAAPDDTAVRVALWRALHVQVDPPPHVLEDEIGLRLAAPGDGWRHRGDMDPGFTSLFRASMSPPELLDEEDRPALQAAMNGARANGTPFISFFAPPEILALARDAGFSDARHVSATVLNRRYFAGRTDGLRTSSAEELLVATT